jgi:Zn-dependent metalloprotease
MRIPSNRPFHRPGKALAELRNRRRSLRFEQLELRALLDAASPIYGPFLNDNPTSLLTVTTNGQTSPAAIASTADARSPLHLLDAAGKPLDIPFNANTLIVGTATWCPHCHDFINWLRQPDVQSRLTGLDVVFTFGNESAQDKGSIYDPTWLQNEPGQVAFIDTSSTAKPTAFPEVYDPHAGNFTQASNAYDWINNWLASRGQSPISDAPLPEVSLLASANDQANQPTSTTIVHFQWSASSAKTESEQGASAPTAWETSTATPAVTAAVTVRYSPLADSIYGMADDGTALSAVHAVTSLPALTTIGSIADQFLSNHATDLGLTHPLQELVPLQVTSDQLGTTTIRYQQIYQGVPVYGSEVLLHLDENLQPCTANGRLLSEAAVDSAATFPQDQAIQLAKTLFLQQYGISNNDSVEVGYTDLYVLNAGLLNNTDDLDSHLAWEVQVAQPSAGTSEYYFFDAHSAQYLGQLSGTNSLSRTVVDCTYILAGGGYCGYQHVYDPTLNYYFGRREGHQPVGPNPFFSTTDVDNVYDMLGFVQNDVLLPKFGRDGGNARGGLINNDFYQFGDFTKASATVYAEISSPDLASSGAGFYYTFGSLFFCSGNAVPDVFGHEYGHSIPFFSHVNASGRNVGMLYQGESGALNESWADCFGEYFEYLYTGSYDWIMFENASFGFDRSLEDPTSVLQTRYGFSTPFPDHYYTSNYYSGTIDTGGTHINSTIPSKAFYLASEGGLFNGYQITGIGIDKAIQVWYRAVTQYYTETETFNGAYAGLVHAAIDLYGTNSNEVVQVKAALKAVELDLYHPAPGVTAPSSQVVARHIFYNNSSFDGNDPAANAADAGAMATDKQALLPGQTASFANYTNYSKGINGVMIDVAHLVDHTSTLSAADFEFHVGNSGDPSTWSLAPVAQSISFDGKEGRVKITWADNAIQNEWLQIRMKANANTGLVADDVFYFGNAIGETGNNPLDAVVDTLDEQAVHDHYGSPVAADNHYDINRDGAVDAADEAIVAVNHTGADPLAVNLVFRHTRTWDGGGADSNWTTAANWADDAAPLPADNLVFPAETAQQDSINDYPTGTVFGLIVVSGGSYQIQNNAILATSVEVQGNAVLTATLIVCDTLTIGSPAAAASSNTASESKADAAIMAANRQELPIVPKIAMTASLGNVIAQDQPSSLVTNVAATIPIADSDSIAVSSVSTPVLLAAYSSVTPQQESASKFQAYRIDTTANQIQHLAPAALRSASRTPSSWGIENPRASLVFEKPSNPESTFLPTRFAKPQLTGIDGDSNVHYAAMKSIFRDSQEGDFSKNMDFDLVYSHASNKKVKLFAKAVDELLGIERLS